MKIKIFSFSKFICAFVILIILLVIGFSIVIANTEDYVEVPIIMYHSILKDASRSNKYTITPTVLEEDLKYLKDNGIQQLPFLI